MEKYLNHYNSRTFEAILMKFSTDLYINQDFPCKNIQSYTATIAKHKKHFKSFRTKYLTVGQFKQKKSRERQLIIKLNFDPDQLKAKTVVKL